MRWLREIIGGLIDAIIGPSDTRIYQGTVKNQRFRIRPTVNDPDVEIGIESQQVVYVTQFKRWWMPDLKRSVFTVQGFAPEDIRPQFDPKLFEHACYPLLCLGMLKTTEYPHVYAIRAYLERVPIPGHKPISVDA